MKTEEVAKFNKNVLTYYVEVINKEARDISARMNISDKIQTQ